MSEEKELTSEQEQAEIDFAKGQAASLAFRRKNPTFKATTENRKKMKEWLESNANGEWTVENLERAFAALPDLERNPAYAPPEPVTPKPDTILPPWGELTKQSLAAMSREDFKHWMANDSRFERQVNNVLAGRGQHE